MKSGFAIVLLSLATVFPANVQARAFACNTSDLRGAEPLQMPTDIYLLPHKTRRVTLGIKLLPNGSFEEIRIAVSARERLFDVAARENAKTMSLTGSCLRQASGHLYVRYIFSFDPNAHSNGIERIWRESSNPVSN